jgi:hypothetical protein
VHRYGIPRGLLDALLDGFLWDTQDRRYETLADVEAYGARVAGTVGAIPAIMNAVIDALSPLGITTLEMPATSEKVWAAIRAAQRAGKGSK